MATATSGRNKLITKSKTSSAFASPSPSIEITDGMAIVICVGCTGLPQLYNTSPQFHELESKLMECSKILQPTTSLSSSILITKCNSQREAFKQRQEIEMMLMSILIDDESLKTNEDVELEKGNILNSHLLLPFSNQKIPKRKSSIIASSKSKFLLKKKFTSTTEKLKYRRKKHRKTMSDMLDGEDELIDRSEFLAATTAFLSVATPPSEVTRILSDQMQVLSFVEKNMYLRSYSGKQQQNGNNIGGGTSSSTSTTRAKHSISGFKSPSRRRGGKHIGSDLSGFDYVSKSGVKANSSNSFQGSGGFSVGSGSSISGMSSTNVSVNFSPRRWRGGNIQQNRISSVNSDITTSTVCSNLSSSDSVISSTSSIPTLSGPTRDSSISKNKERRNKVRKAVEANNQSRSLNYAISLDNGGMGQSPQKNKVKFPTNIGGVSGTLMKINKEFNMKRSQQVTKTTSTSTTSNFDPFVVDDDHSSNKETEARSQSSSSTAITTTSNSTPYSNYSISGPGFGMNSLPNGGGDNIKGYIEGVEAKESAPITNYVPGSRKLFVNIALNEDLSCTYRNAKLSAFTVEGSVQILLKSDSTAFVPFTVVLNDVNDYLDQLVENTKFTSVISKESHSFEDSFGTKNKFMVTLPRYDQFFDILKYKCKSSLLPVPLRVQSRTKTNKKDCQVALQISSNPENEKSLSDFTIIMMVPKNAIGESLETQPVGGIYNASKRSVIWCVSHLGKGEKFQLHAQFKLDKTVEEMNGEKPSFPILVRCQSLYAHLSGIVVECEDEPKGFPADVNTKVARRFRVSHREREATSTVN